MSTPTAYGITAFSVARTPPIGRPYPGAHRASARPAPRPAARRRCGSAAARLPRGPARRSRTAAAACSFGKRRLGRVSVPGPPRDLFRTQARTSPLKPPGRRARPHQAAAWTMTRGRRSSWAPALARARQCRTSRSAGGICVSQSGGAERLRARPSLRRLVGAFERRHCSHARSRGHPPVPVGPLHRRRRICRGARGSARFPNLGLAAGHPEFAITYQPQATRPRRRARRSGRPERRGADAAGDIRHAAPDRPWFRSARP